VEKPERKRPLEDLDTCGMIILKWTLRDTEWDGVDWLDLPQHRDQWSALVNTVMHFQVLLNVGKFFSG
jgi:hypothetical protein